jgi:hypothetical protein
MTDFAKKKELHEIIYHNIYIKDANTHNSRNEMKILLRPHGRRPCRDIIRYLLECLLFENKCLLGVPYLRFVQNYVPDSGNFCRFF